MFISRGLKALGAAVVPILIFSQTAIASPTFVTYQTAQTAAAGSVVSVDYLNMLGIGGTMRTAFVNALTNSENNGYPIYVTDSSNKVIDYEAALAKGEGYTGAVTDTAVNNATAPTATSQLNPDGTVSAIAPAVTVASVSAVNSTVAVGSSTGFTFLNSSGVAVSPTGVTYSITSSNASTGFINGAGIFTATAAGMYTIQATIGSTNLTTTVIVTGQAAGVTLSAATPTLVDNLITTDAITATVVDANGARVYGFNGTATLSITNGNTSHLVDSNGKQVSVVNFTNGVGTFNLLAPSSVSPASDTIYVSALTSTNGQGVSTNPTYGTTTVNYLAQQVNALKVTPATASLGTNNAANSDVLTIDALDLAGQKISTIGITSVTVTLTGPGSFTQVNPGGTPTTTLPVALTGSGNTSVTVYPIQGQTGTIAVTASAAGITSGNANINLVVAGNIANFTVNNSQGVLTQTQATNINVTNLPVGTSYTLYTVQFSDAYGNPVIPTNPDSLTIVDNSILSTTQGSLYYYKYNTSDQSFNTTPLNTTGSATTFTVPYTDIATGTYTFAVMNAAVGSANPTITITDNALSTSKTASYTFTSGPVATAGLATNENQNQTFNIGSTANVTFQLLDKAGNNAKVAGQSVNIWFTAPIAGITVGTVQQPSATGQYVLTSDSNGIITVPVQISSTAVDASTFIINAAFGSGSSQMTINGTARATASTLSTLTLSTTALATGAMSTPSTIAATAGAAVATGASDILGFNGVKAIPAVNTDTISVTSSNPLIVALATGGAWTANTSLSNATAPLVAGVVAPPTMNAVGSGTATITITDVSNPSVPALTFNVAVAAGTASATGQIQYNGVKIGSNNPVIVAAGSPVPVTIYNVDGNGNALPVSSAEAHSTASGAGASFSLADTGGGSFRATANGTSISYVTIPVGQTSAAVYYVNPTAGSYSAMTALTPLAQTAITATAAAATEGTPFLLTVGLTADTFTGTLPITITGAAASPFGNAAVLPTSVAFVSGTATETVPVTLYNSAASQVLTVNIAGLSHTATVTMTPSSTNAVTLATSGSTTMAANTVATNTITPTTRDVYGNLTTGDTISYAITTSPGSSTGVTVGAATGIFSVTGNASPAGTYVVTATDGGHTATTTFILQ